MADLRLVCTGVRVGPIFIPPFQLRLGELICLHLPPSAPDDLEKDLVRVLAGQRPAPSLCLLGRVLPAAAARDDRIGLMRLLRPLRATRWLRRRTGISSREASAALRRIGLDRDWPLTHLAGTPKALLGLEAAWDGAAEIVVFQTAGLDPSGRQAVYAAVAAKLASCPAIHLSRLIFQDGRPLRDCFPGARCVELTPSSAPPLPAASA